MPPTRGHDRRERSADDHEITGPDSRRPGDDDVNLFSTESITADAVPVAGVDAVDNGWGGAIQPAGDEQLPSRRRAAESRQNAGQNSLPYAGAHAARHDVRSDSVSEELGSGGDAVLLVQQAAEFRRDQSSRGHAPGCVISPGADGSSVAVVDGQRLSIARG